MIRLCHWKCAIRRGRPRSSPPRETAQIVSESPQPATFSTACSRLVAGLAIRPSRLATARRMPIACSSVSVPGRSVTGDDRSRRAVAARLVVQEMSNVSSMLCAPTQAQHQSSRSRCHSLRATPRDTRTVTRAANTTSGKTMAQVGGWRRRTSCRPATPVYPAAAPAMHPGPGIHDAAFGGDASHDDYAAATTLTISRHLLL